ncbi:uncharacterized protein [Parasteatoda tepidariorum]|uniref:uncharacterized protein n=1 Tax=Parasteatoda tepidariorum TaxID=114398 RepID=UPI00077FCEA0|nr:uncharacterized protein LOC107448159 [Parasteatoda tepidariorum]
MLDKIIFVIYFTLCLVNSVLSDTEQHLLSYEATTIKHIEDDFTRSEAFKHVTTLSFLACRKRYTVQLQVYFPLYYETRIKIVSSGRKEFSHQADIDDYTLYHGQVKDVNNSFVLGYFLVSGGFQGYIMTDHICCIDSLHEKNGVTIAYRFKDAVPPGCRIDRSGKEIDCLQSERFEPWFLGILYDIDWQRRDMSRNVSDITRDLFPATDMLSQAETETIDGKIKWQAITLANLSNKATFGNRKAFFKKREIPQTKISTLEHEEDALLHEEILRPDGGVEYGYDHPDVLPGIGDFSVKSSRFRPNDLSCGLKIVVSRTLMEFFEKSTTDVVKDIFLQTEMLNILYRKISFRNKTKTFKMNFHIDTIILPSKELVEETEEMSLNDFIEKYTYFHSSLQPACLIVGLDMVQENTKKFFVSSHENGEPCSKIKNTIIVSHGTLNKPEPMALYLAQYVTTITRAFGATDSDKICQTGYPPNPMVLIENYYLSSSIEPTFSYGIFSACNVREMEKKLSDQKCFEKFEYSTCGNAIREDGEECDCGPKRFCEEIDKCCEPPTPIFQSKIGKHSNNTNSTQCMLRPEAECATKDACCNDCKFAYYGTKCVDRAHHCSEEMCLGNSSECICVANSSQSKSHHCKGLECGSIPCATDSLKPCLCTGKDECLVCCIKHDVCKTATRDLKVMGDLLLAFPDGTKCGVADEDAQCYNGSCIVKRKDPFKPKTGQAQGDSDSNESSGGSKISLCFGFLIGFLLLTILFHISTIWELLTFILL